MNSLERIVATVGFGTPDRTPVIAQVFGHTAALAGVGVDEYVRDGELLARCQMQGLDRYGYDAVFALMDANVETEAVGSVLRYRPGQYPTVDSYALAGGANLDALEIPDPRKAGRMPQLLKATSILRREVGDDVLVVGCVIGPMTLAAQLMGMEEALYTAVDQPEIFHRVLEFSTEIGIRFGLAQLEAGAHLPIVFDPASTSEVVPPAFYREIVAPYLHRLFAALKAAGSAVNWIHTAGQITPILPYLPGLGVELVNIDYPVDPAVAIQALPQTCVDGNIKPLAFMDASPEWIAAESARLLDIFAGRGGFILSSGCEIPVDAKPENVAAMVAATRQKR